MVEANEEVKIMAQPQDSNSTGGDDEISIVMDALDRKYNIDLIKERVEALTKFKQEISIHSLTYAKFESE
jgi:hypothetical protein